MSYILWSWILCTRQEWYSDNIFFFLSFPLFLGKIYIIYGIYKNKIKTLQQTWHAMKSTLSIWVYELYELAIRMLDEHRIWVCIGIPFCLWYYMSFCYINWMKKNTHFSGCKRKNQQHESDEVVVNEEGRMNGWHWMFGRLWKKGKVIRFIFTNWVSSHCFSTGFPFLLALDILVLLIFYICFVVSGHKRMANDIAEWQDRTGQRGWQTSRQIYKMREKNK